MKKISIKQINLAIILIVTFLLICGTLAESAPLQVTVAPSGTGTLTLSQSGTDQVTLSATPAQGYYFSGFSGLSGLSGGTNGTDSQLSLNLTANFSALATSVGQSGSLSVSPGLLAASGAIAGAYSPTYFTYSLSNPGSSTIQWSAAVSAPWLTLTSSGGSLPPGASTTLSVTLTDLAWGLGTGYYTATVRFSNLTNALGDTVRPASLVVADRPGEIGIVTDGESFSPVLTVDAGARVLWSWADGTTSSSPAPSKNFGSSGVRVNRLSVTPWSALKRINLGYDASDGGDPAIEQLPPQSVVAVSGLEHVAPYLQKWCSAYSGIVSLNFDNFVNLDTIECFHASGLVQVSLHNTPKLSRACFEQCQLGALDFSESPALADLRGAANPIPGVNFGPIGTQVWHICTRDTQFSQSLPPMIQFPQLRELLIWNDNQTGALTTASPQLALVLASHNRYTAADFSNSFVSGNGWLDLSDNQLSSLVLNGCSSLIHVAAANNNLQTDAVDSVLETLDSLGRYTGYLDLRGNFPPSAAGLAHAANLRQRLWVLDLATH